MRLRDRLLLIGIIGAATTALDQRGAFRSLDSRLHDASLAALDAISSRFASKERGTDERCRVIAVKPRDSARGFTVDEVIENLERLGKRANATAWVAFPPALEFTDIKRVERLAKALHLLGRVGLAWPNGETPLARAALDRIGDGFGLPSAIGFAPLPSDIDNAVEFVTRDRLEPGPDGIVRFVAIGELVGESLIPTPPLAIAASALHESSIAISRDGWILESLGGTDHHLAAPLSLRVRPNSSAHRILTMDEALALPVEKSNPPILLIAFEGAHSLTPIALSLRSERTPIQVIADVTEDLLRARAPHLADGLIVLVIALLAAAGGAFAADVARRFAALSALISAVVITTTFSLAITSSLPSLTAYVGASALGFAVAGKR